MQNSRKWVEVIILIIVLIAVFAGSMLFINKQVENALSSAFSPIIQANEQIKEQINQVLNPTPIIIPDPITIIHEVRGLARLETIQYSVEKVITADSGIKAFEALFGDKLLFIAHGYVIAGIDLGKMTAEDMWVKDGVLFVRMPEPEIFVATLDNNKSYVYDRETGLLRRGNIQLETMARQAAEEEIRKSAFQDGILDLAEQNAINFLTGFLVNIGYSEIYFETNETE